MLARDGRADVAGGLEWTAVDLPASDATAVGTTVGKYDILEEIGRGGMGVVYLARQRGLERHVALKALHAATGLGVGAAEALVKESRIAGSLSHPNIVTVYEFLEEGETPYIVMEYVQRGSLRPWIGCMSLAQFTGVFEELLAGLAAVEPSGIVHRDLKPENVMVTADGRVKIADFGIAKATQRAGSLAMASTPTGVTVGTPAYMAPEQALCEEVGPHTDLYSVGIMAYEHLVGHVPFRNARTAMAILLAHINDPVAPAAEVEPRVDRALSDWVARLLKKDPEQRTKSASRAWDELEEIAIGRLGPMWRREARLTERARTRISPRRLDPAQFNSQAVTMGPATSVDSMFVTTRVPSEGHPGRTLERPTLPVPAGASRALNRHNRGALALLAVAAAIAALGGYAVARTVDTTPSPRGPRAATGSLSVSLPAGWVQSRTGVYLPGYKFDSPLELRSSRSSGGMTIGLTSAPSAALLPTALLARGSPTPHRDVVTLGGNAFFRFRGATLGGSRESASIYTQPTTAGVLVGVCRLPTPSAIGVNVGCERALASLSTASAEALPTTQSTRYLTELSRAMAAFNAATKTAGAALSSATDSAAQADHASELRRASAIASDSLRAAEPGPSEQAVNAALVSTLTRLSGGFATLASAGQSRTPQRWQTGADVVGAASRALQGELAALRSAG